MEAFQYTDVPNPPMIQEQQLAQQQHQVDYEQIQHNKSMVKKNLKLGIFIIAILCLLFGLYCLSSSSSKPSANLLTAASASTKFYYV